MKRILKFENILTAILIFTFVIVLVSNVYSCFVIRGVKESREMVMVKTSFDFSQLINPYSIEYFSVTRPMNTSVYGFLAPLFFAPFIHIFGQENALLVSELICIILSLIGVLIFYNILNKLRINKILCLSGAFLYYICYFNFNDRYVDAKPNQLALTIFVLLLYFLIVNEKKYSINLYIALCIILYYTKQYFIIVSFGIFIYLLIKDNKIGISFAIKGILCGIISIIIVNYIFPMYFSLTFARPQVDVNFSIDIIRVKYIIIQLLSLMLNINLIIYIVSLIEIIMNFKDILFKKIKIKSSFKNLNFELVMLIVLVLPVTFISTNTGQYCEYYIQLIYPFLIIIFIKFMDRVLNKNFSFKYLNYRIKNKIVLILCSMIAILNITTKFVNVYDEEIINWVNAHNEIYKILEVSGDKIIVPPYLSSYCMEKGIYCDDYGQTEYLNETLYDKYKNKKINKIFFSYLFNVYETNIYYKKEVQQKVYQGYYNTIVLTHVLGNLNESNLLISDDVYYLHKEVKISTGGQSWDTKIYRKKNRLIKNII